MSKLDLAKTVEELVKEDITRNLVVVYGRKNCMKLSELEAKLVYAVNQSIVSNYIDNNGDEEEKEYLKLFKNFYGATEMPIVFLKKAYIGDYNHILPMLNNKAETFLKILADDFQYGICIIGGGTCGLTAAMEASKDLLVALCDYDMNTMHENDTCLGTASKMNMELLFKFTAHKELFHAIGLNRSKRPTWRSLMKNVREKIQNRTRENFQQVRKNQSIRYFNGRVQLLDSHTVKVIRSLGTEKIITARKIVIATGTKAKKTEDENFKLAVTLEDVYKLDEIPAKILIIGDTMTCLEHAPILKGFGATHCTISPTGTSNMFDLDLIGQLQEVVQNHGIRIISGYTITKLSTDDQSKPGSPSILVHGITNEGEKFTEPYNSVVLAYHRTGRTESLCLHNVGLRVKETNRKIIGNENGTTSNSSVFVTGGVLDNPHTHCENSTFVQHALILIRGIRTNKFTKLNMLAIPRVVLTPKEYGALGDTEETAIIVFGKRNITTYQTNIEMHFIKTICLKGSEERVLGIHILGYKAADLMQPFVTCLNKGIRLKDAHDIAEFELINKKHSMKI